MDRIPAIRRAILADIPFAKGALWSAVAVAVPTALRWSIGNAVPGNGFVTYYPAVALTALFLGWRWGAVVAVVSTAAANRLFGEQSFWELLTGPNGLIVALFVLSCAVLILTGEMARRLVRELEAAKARESLLNEELMHRVKNLLATVNAMAMLTARHSEPGQFSQAFSGRMRALDRATELLGTDRLAHCEVRKLVENAIEPFRAEDNFTIDGPGCELPRDACVPLSLALHELCTNATKHGALSVPDGKVSLCWTCDDAGLLTILWREEGGPPVTAPRRTGMGTQLLRRQRGLKFVEVRFDPAGACCEIQVEGVFPTGVAAR